MTANSSFRRLLPWLSAILISVAFSLCIIEAVRVYLENDRTDLLEIQVGRRATEISAQTLNGNVMGAMATLGLINPFIKQVVRGELPPQDPLIIETFEAIGKALQANGVYVINQNGTVQSSWHTVGQTLTGLDVKSRPYFQVAMQGKQNVYAAMSVTTGFRGLYFAAPVHEDVSASSHVIGAMVARLDLQRVDAVLKAWQGLALLLSPQGLAFASNRDQWVGCIAEEPTPEKLKEIRDLKQFGNAFQNATPKILPFDLARDTISFDNRRYAVARAPVEWNDPNGEWKLVLLSDLDALMPISLQVKIGAISGILMLGLSFLFVFWRHRLRHANEERLRAEMETTEYADDLKRESAKKSYIAEMSADLQQSFSLAEFARKFMFRVAPRLDADYGVFYVFDKECQLLIAAGGRGVVTDDLEKIAIGQGLVGQCAQTMTPILISNSQETDIRVVWGQGEISPNAIIFQPIERAGDLLGVIVLAVLRSMESEKRELLDELMPMVAMNLEILIRNLGAQRQAETLQKQQTYLLETEAWYRGIVESFVDGVLVIDESGMIILTNQQLDTMFGYGPGVLVGQDLEVLVPARLRTRHVTLREHYFQAGESRSIEVFKTELRGVRQDGAEFPVNIGLSKLPTIGERGVCVCASVRDMSEHRRV